MPIKSKMTEMEFSPIIPDKIALDRGLSRWFNGEVCCNGHLCERKARNGDYTKKDGSRRKKAYCIECKADKQRRAHANRPEYKERARKSAAASCRKYPEKQNAKAMKRHAAKLKATPSWANDEKIKAIYKESRRLQDETGIPHNVDHIYPLQSDWVCGLHVEFNLQILTKIENLSKGNRKQDYHK